MNEVGTQTGIAISGTFVFTDKDGNVIKETPFTGVLKDDETEPEVKDGDVRE